MTSRRRPDQLEEALLVSGAIRGDRAAFRRKVDAYEERVLYFIRQRVGDEDTSFDVLQETWVATFRQLPQLRSPEAFRVWLYRIARGKVVEHFRRHGREATGFESVSDVDLTITDDQPLAFDSAELVHVTLGRLTADHREILMLYFLEDLSLEQIAQVLGCPLGTAKSRMYYAKRAFRAAVEKHDNDDTTDKI